MPELGFTVKVDHDRTLVGIISLLVIAVVLPILLIFWPFNNNLLFNTDFDSAVERIGDIGFESSQVP